MVRAILISVGLVVIVITASICYEVIMRSVFNVPVIWVDEVASYLMGYITFVGAAAALYEGTHVGVDLLTARLSAPSAKALRAIADTVMLMLGAVLAYLSGAFWLDALVTGENSGTLLGVLLWIPYLSLFVGTVFLVLIQITRMAMFWPGAITRADRRKDAGRKWE